MIRYEDNCVGCAPELGCIGEACPYQNMKEYLIYINKKMYELNISVELSSAWQKIKDEVQMDLAKQEADVKKVEAEATTENNPEEPKEEKKEGDNDAKETE